MSKKKKIIFLAKYYYPHIGGVEKHIYELSKILVKRGYVITIIAERTEENNFVSQEYALKGVTVRYISTGKDNWFKKFRIWSWMWKNRKKILQSDVIHCHDVFYWYLPLAIIHPLKGVYTTFHGYESYPISKKAVIYRKVFEYMSNKSICVGDFMRKWYHANPTAVIYGGVHHQKIESNYRKNSAIFIGRLDEHTGILTYVDAVKLIRKKIPTFTLTVYGDGPLKDRINTEGVIVKGFVHDVDKEIKNYEYAFVSRYLAILEAFAAKKRVFAHYDNPVKKDYLILSPYHDWIYVFNSAKNLASEVIKKNNSSTHIENSYTWVINQTWEKVADEYLKLWTKF